MQQILSQVLFLGGGGGQRGQPITELWTFVSYRSIILNRRSKESFDYFEYFKHVFIEIIPTIWVTRNQTFFSGVCSYTYFMFQKGQRPKKKVMNSCFRY